MEFQAKSICFRREQGAEEELTTFLGTTVRLAEDKLQLDFTTSEYASSGADARFTVLDIPFSALRGMMVGTRISEAFLALSADGFEQILIEPEPTSLRAMEKLLRALTAAGKLSPSSCENGCEIYLRDPA